MPNRVLRDWTTSETIDTLTPGAEIFFTRLIMKADDFGNYTANPKLLKAALFPLKPYGIVEIGAWINECVTCGAIKKYSHEGKNYLNIPNFGQRLRAMRSQYPDPSQSSDGHVSDNGRPETKRNETESETEKKSPTFEEKFLLAFDEITCERYKMTFKGLDLGAELQQFKIKCDNDPQTYHHRDSAGLRTAFQYQLKNSKSKKNGSAVDKFAEAQRIIREQGNI
jgi:hypothetical protein